MIRAILILMRKWCVLLIVCPLIHSVLHKKFLFYNLFIRLYPHIVNSLQDFYLLRHFLLNFAFSLQPEKFLNFCINVQPFLHLMKWKSAFFAPFVISLHTHTHIWLSRTGCSPNFYPGTTTGCSFRLSNCWRKNFNSKYFTLHKSRKNSAIKG